MFNSGKKIISFILVLFLFVGMVGIVNVDTSYAASKKIHLKKTTVSVVAGKTYQQKLIDKKGKTIKATKIKWKSSKTSVARINKKGKITAVKAGTAKMTARYKGKTYKFTVKVKKAKSSNDYTSKIYNYVNTNGFIPEDNRYISGDYCVESEIEYGQDSNGYSTETTYAISIKRGDKTKVYFNMYYKSASGTEERTILEYNAQSSVGYVGFLQFYYTNNKWYHYISEGEMLYNKYTGKSYSTEKGIVNITYGDNKNPAELNSYNTKALVEAEKKLVVGVDKLLNSKMKIRLRSIGFNNL